MSEVERDVTARWSSADNFWQTIALLPYTARADARYLYRPVAD